MNEWWKVSPACQSCNDYENCDEPCAMAMSFLQGGMGKNNEKD